MDSFLNLKKIIKGDELTQYTKGDPESLGTSTDYNLLSWWNTTEDY